MLPFGLLWWLWLVWVGPLIVRLLVSLLASYPWNVLWVRELGQSCACLVGMDL